MSSFSKQNTNKSRTILFMVMVLVLVSVGTAFGQSSAENNTDSNVTLEINSPETIVTRQEDASSNSNMNFVLWFMSSKQDPNSKITPSRTNTKKQIITSGATPNRLLIKAFLKKAVNFESGIV